MADLKTTVALVYEAAAEAGIPPHIIESLKRKSAEFFCPGLVGQRSIEYSESSGQTSLAFKFAQTHCFFYALREVLTMRHGEPGTQVANLLAAIDIQQISASKQAAPFDAELTTLLEGTKMVSVADMLDGVVRPYAARWKIDYSNIGDLSSASTNPDRPDFIGLDSINPSSCDYIWACNVVSRGAIGENIPKGLSEDFLIYQTLASLVSMLKPETGKLLCVNQYEPRAHESLSDKAFHQWLDVSTKHPDTMLYEFQRISGKTLTPLDFCRWYGDNQQRIDPWPSF